MNIKRGNANDGVGNTTRGWMIGHFAEGDFCNKNFEVKWGVHPKDDRKTNIAENEKAKWITILIKGKFSIFFYNKDDLKNPVKECLLQKTGDYVFSGSKIPHDWKAWENSTTITIRWPSIEGDQHIVK